jgi:hypothetical protein
VEGLRVLVAISTTMLASYLLSMLVGYILARRGILHTSLFVRNAHRLSDPWTPRVHAWMRKYKTACMRRGNWGGLLLLILLNNLVLGAFIGGTLYGLVFFPPYVIAVWRGLAQGTLSSRMRPRPRSFLAAAPMLEFIGYLLAGAVGVNLGLSLLSSVAARIPTPFFAACKAAAHTYPLVAVLLALGALFEIAFLVKMSRLPGAREKMVQVDLEECVREYVRRMGEEPSSAESR